MRWSRRVNMPSLYLKWKNSGICSSPRGEAAVSVFLSLSLQCWSLILDSESVIPFWLIEFTLYCKLMLLLHISRLFSSTHLLASYQTSRFSSPVYSQCSFYWLFKIDAHHAYQAATYFCMRLSNPQWQSDSHCVLRTVLRTVCTLHVRCFLQVFILHQFWHGTDTCCLIGFPSSQIDMIRGYKQLLNQECSNKVEQQTGRRPLGELPPQELFKSGTDRAKPQITGWAESPAWKACCHQGSQYLLRYMVTNWPGGLWQVERTFLCCPILD